MDHSEEYLDMREDSMDDILNKGHVLLASNHILLGETIQKVMNFADY